MPGFLAETLMIRLELSVGGASARGLHD